MMLFAIDGYPLVIVGRRSPVWCLHAVCLDAYRHRGRLSRTVQHQPIDPLLAQIQLILFGGENLLQFGIICVSLLVLLPDVCLHVFCRGISVVIGLGVGGVLLGILALVVLIDVGLVGFR